VDSLRSSRALLAGLLVTVVAVVAVAGGLFDSDGAAGPTASSTPPTTADAFSDEEIAAARARYQDAADATADLVDRLGPDDGYDELEARYLEEYADPDAAARLVADDAPLDGQVLEPTRPLYGDGDAGPGEAATVVLDGKTLTLASSEGPDIRVYFVNGVLNTSKDAAIATDRFSRLLGVPVTLVYNHSILEPRDITVDICARSLRRIADRPREYDGVVDLLEVDDPLSVLQEAVVRGAGDPVIRAAAKACGAVEGIAETVGKGWSYLSEFVSNNVQLAAQRVLNTDLASRSVNDRLVAAMQADIAAGRRVVVMGHSQGTLFLRNAMARINEWYSKEYGSTCNDGSTPSLGRARVAPVGALYISPAFPAKSEDDLVGFDETGWGPANERYVLLEGDILHAGADTTGVAVGSLPVTARATKRQQGTGVMGAVGLSTHELATYLEEGSESFTQIVDGFGDLMQWASETPPNEEPCPGATTTSTTEVDQAEHEWVVWEGVNFNVGVHITTRKVFETDEVASTYPDGGLDPETILEKKLITKQYWDTYDDAFESVCSQFDDVAYGPSGLGGIWTDGEYHFLAIACPIDYGP
jgi:hypothetical protein